MTDMPKFIPLEFDGVDEGRFKGSVNLALAEVQNDLIKFVKKHKEKAKGAKAGVIINITLAKEDKGDGIFSIKATVQQKRPAVPASLTMAMETEKDDGESALFVRASGSGHDDPKQAVLCTQDGRTVDPASGQPDQAAPATVK
jgi:hypothetical protein